MNYLLVIHEEPGQRSQRSLHEGQAAYDRMLGFAEALKVEGKLRAVESLQSDDKGRRVQVRNGQPRFVDGPFTEAKELVAGYTLIQVRSREEALEWARRFPNPALDGGRAEIEVRQLFELEDFEPGDAIERFREIEGRQPPRGHA